MEGDPMASFNRVILVGNITRDIELRYTPGGTAVTEIGMAVNDRRKNQAGEWVEETTFIDVTLWSRTAEIADQYLGKGSSILIEGRLKLDTWETDGQKRSKLRVVGERMQMLGGRGGSNEGGGGRSASQFNNEAAAVGDGGAGNGGAGNGGAGNESAGAGNESAGAGNDEIPF
jgi:single-strand DNA-binding protein